MQDENHFMGKTGWLRAAVLGANDGILSTASIVIGVAAGSESRNPIVLAAVAGAIAGAMSMAAGEYVSVSSQSDSEQADLRRERKELEEMPDAELEELAGIYERRGVSKATALQVAKELHAHDALGTHAREELGINEITEAKPLQAAMASFSAFIVGAILPLAVAIAAPLPSMIYWQYGFSIIFLAFLGALAAKTGGASVKKAVLRICFWGTAAMLATALVGYLFGVRVG